VVIISNDAYLIIAFVFELQSFANDKPNLKKQWFWRVTLARCPLFHLLLWPSIPRRQVSCFCDWNRHRLLHGIVVGGVETTHTGREIQSFMDLDFISLGWPLSNELTAACQNNGGANGLAILNKSVSVFVTWPENTPFHGLDTEKFDYGLILKIHPSEFPESVWIACAALNERGTWGAAWFLANKWAEIKERAGDKPFATLICVDKNVLNGRDQSATLVEFRKKRTSQSRPKGDSTHVPTSRRSSHG
jgi:hypothetical protein